MVRDPFQNILEGLSKAEEEIIKDFTSIGDIKMLFSNKSRFEFWAGPNDEFSALKTKAFPCIITI